MRSRLPISRTTSRTNTADLVSSFVLANEMLVNPVLGIDILFDASDPGATFDSQDHYDRRCFPGTREQYIADITNWVTESVNPPSSMYWMRGPAGVGKSAIAQTCAEKLKKSGHLGAAFFFTVNKHTNPSRLFTSIAYQLATALSDYRAALDERISKDKSLVEKKIPFQFGSLIVEPIQELEKQGKRIQPKAIFIDGLDECASKDAQAEIIKIIASSVRERSTPFHWAIFSRAEPRIVSTFKQDNIASVIHSVELPISREADNEIEMYLRGGFKNILEQQDSPQLSSSWPTDNDIWTLVKAAAGLFAHPAAVLRHVAYPPDSQFCERLQSVLATLSDAGKQGSTSFSQLDALYIHIMEQIPEHILLSAQLLLSYSMSSQGFNVSLTSCMFRISECTFREICRHLHAVISYKPSFHPLSSIDPRIDLTRPYYDQGQWFHPDQSIMWHVWSTHGTLRFYHKSFYDFLCDPTRSSAFCVSTSAIYCKYLDHFIQCHHHYASSYAIDGSSMYFLPLYLSLNLLVIPDLVSAPGITNSSTALSWSHGTEFVDSYFKLATLTFLSFWLSHDDSSFCRFIDDIPFAILRRLADVDYRKSLIAMRMWWDFRDKSNASMFDIPATAQTLSHTVFGCISTRYFNALVPAAFLLVCFKYDYPE